MKLVDLYTRVVETTGLEVVTLDSLKTAVSNCMADLTSRGYRTFVELTINDLTPTFNGNMVSFCVPTNMRKCLYIRLFFNECAIVANRYSMGNRYIASVYQNGTFRSPTLTAGGKAIFYIKGDNIFIEWNALLGTPTNIAFGYYKKLSSSLIGVTDQTHDVAVLQQAEFEIREEFEDAVVFYAAYFYYARYIKDTDKIQLYLNIYKYYVEDILHELGSEDIYNEDDIAIVHEE